jgi:WD40 repeat protein
MHIYHSALPWSPTLSLTRELYQKQMTEEVKLVNAIDANWGACLRTIPIPNRSIAITFSHNGSALAIVSDDDMKIFETATGVTTAFEVDQSIVEVHSVAFSPDGSRLVCGLEDGSVRVLEVQTGDSVQSFKGHVGKVSSVAFSTCGKNIVSGGHDKTVRIWDVSFEPGSSQCVLKDHSKPVSAVCWSRTGDRVISGSEDKSVKIWDVSKQTCVATRYHTNWVTSVASSCDSLVASGSKDGRVNVYDTRNGNTQSIQTSRPIRSVQFSTHDGKLLFTNENSQSICDLSTMQVSTTNFGGFGAAFSPEGTRVASGFDRFVKIWNTETRGDSNSDTVIHHSAKIDAITFAPDGLVMVSQSCSNYDVKIWDTTLGDHLFTFDSHSLQSIVFSPNSAFVACWSGDFFTEAQVWDVRTHTRVKNMRLNVENVPSSVALSPCGGKWVSQSPSHIILLDLGNGECLARLNFDSSSLGESQISFAVDGSSIFIHAGDNIIQRWSVHSTPLPSNPPPTDDQHIAPTPQVFISMQGDLSHPVVSMPRQCYHFEGDEWILNEDGKRVLWLPPDRRGLTIACGKKIAVGAYPSGIVYLADFQDALLPT